MKKYKVGVIGYFAAGKSKAGGQEAKTCSIDRAMREKYGNESVYNVDTTCWKRHPLKLLVGIVLMCAKCENIIMLPAQNGLKIFIPLFELLNIIFNKKLFYSVVGGWLPIYLKKNKRLQKQCRKLNGIFVETRSMKVALNDIGIKNVSVIPNFKYLTPITISSVKRSFKKPYTLCTFSRIMKEKGIDQYLDAAKFIKEKYPNTEFHVCGFCEKEYEGKLNEYNDNGTVIYHGMIHDVAGFLENMNCVVHPTYYPEGLSNVLLEASACGRPIITTDRSGCREVVDDGINGYMIPQKNSEKLIEAIDRFMNLSYEEKRGMGLAARKKVEENFDRSIVVEAYMREIK